MLAIRALEVGGTTTLAGPAYSSLRQEASQYARWALRTSQGRNYKPAYKPKSAAQLEDEASIEIQAWRRPAPPPSLFSRGWRKHPPPTLSFSQV